MSREGPEELSEPMLIACIPAYNEEETVARVIISAQRHVDKVILCDDGSTDLTGEIAERVGALVYRHENNEGKGAALKTLFARSLELGAQIVVTIDGDGQHNADEIPNLAKPILDGQADIVVGSRINHASMPIHRKLGNRILSAFTNLPSKTKVTDTQSGFRAYSKGALEAIEISEEGIGVDSQILLDASQKGLRIAEVEVGVQYEGKTSTYHPVKHALNVIVAVVKAVIGRRPLVYLGLPGLVFVIGGILLFASLFQAFNQAGYFSMPLALLAIGGIVVGLILVVAALILFAIADIASKIRKIVG